MTLLLQLVLVLMLMLALLPWLWGLGRFGWLAPAFPQVALAAHTPGQWLGEASLWHPSDRAAPSLPHQSRCGTRQPVTHGRAQQEVRMLVQLMTQARATTTLGLPCCLDVLRCLHRQHPGT